ncbi:MAG TPA: WecB/TagA/CpsF family glycosyltransferase [Patescibacteria group bacterium]
MSKINIAGVLVDDLTKQQVLEEIHKNIQLYKSVYVVTPYSEQIVFASEDKKYNDVLNNAALSLPDGIGILWAAKYLSLPGVYWPFVKTLFAIILNPKYIRSIIPEQVTGRHLVYDVIKLANDNNYSLALVGGENNVAAQTAYELKKTYPNVKVNLALSGRPFDAQIVREIADSNSDILLIAYSPPKQEMWIADNLQNLNVKLAIGLGGTFDYLAKRRPPAPIFVHYMGLEWLWRLITQPWRIKRIWNAVPVFVIKILRYKLRK